MLRLEGVCLNYGSFRALDSVDMHVDAGEIVVILGANGAGKSSLFMAISGLRKLERGSRITFDGKDLVGARPAHIVSQGIVHCPEGRKLFPGMSVERNLLLGAYLYPQDTKTREALERVFEMFPMLGEKRAREAKSLSGGQQQMLAIGRALMGRPRVLLLDEPSLGLAPLIVKQVLETAKQINAAGTAIMLAEQNAYAALQIAHRGYVLENGRVVMGGDRQTLTGNDRVRRAYLGVPSRDEPAPARI